MKRTIRIYSVGVIIVVVFALLMSLITGCTGQTDEETIRWVEQHRKPILTEWVESRFGAWRKYTLIDADGNIYQSGRTTMNLPDTIKLIP